MIIPVDDRLTGVPIPLLGIIGRHRMLVAVEVTAVREFGVELKRVLWTALLCFIIDMDQAEALAVAEGPLEVVEQRPDEITAHRNAGRDRILHRTKIGAQIADAVFVADAPVGSTRSGKAAPFSKM